jgi:hypothetical protein
VPDCSASGTNFFSVGCSDDIAVATDTSFESATGSNASSAADIPMGGHACIARVNCLRNRGDCCSRTEVHSS